MPKRTTTTKPAEELSTGLLPAPEPGVYPGLPMQTYLRWDCADNSALKSMESKTPGHFRYDKTHPDPLPALPVSKPKHHFALGTAVHTLALEPANADEHLCILPPLDYRSNDDKALWYAIRDANPDKVFLRPELAKEAQNMVDTARETNPFIAQLFDLPGDCELSVVHDWESATPGRLVRSKIRIDKLLSIGDLTIIADIKTCMDASKAAFSKSMADFGYYRQGGMYLDIARQCPDIKSPDAFVFIAMEKTPPYFSQCHLLPVPAAEQGAKQNREMLDVFADCMDADVWPGYAEGLTETDLPIWFWKRIV